MLNMRNAFSVAVIGAAALYAAPVAAQTTRRPLHTTSGLRPYNTTVEVVTHQGRRGLRVAVAPAIAGRPGMPAAATDFEALVHIDRLPFANGVIEVEVAGRPAEGSSAGARGFVGIAFRVQSNADTVPRPIYDAFYLRPTNGRALDQERRNHAAQYISHPAWTWSRLRQETPSRYEAYVDLAPDTWTRMRIEVRGMQAKLFVHGQTQPTLIVNDVKTGPSGSGGVALWIGPETVAHFRNLVVTPEP